MKKLILALVVLFMFLSSFSFAETLNPFILSSSVRLVESTLGCDLFSAASDNPDIQAFINRVQSDVIDHYSALGFARDSINGFLEDCFCMPLTVSKFSPVSVKVCAEYYFCTDFAACRTGTQAENMLLYGYSSDGTASAASDQDLWRYFEMLKTYLSENATSIVLDGINAGAEVMSVVIDIHTSADYNRAVFDLITGDCSINTI